METWKEVPGYEGMYEVSDLGNVRAIPRVVGYRFEGMGSQKKGRPIKVFARKRDGRRMVGLSRGGNLNTFPVARLVLLAFVGPAEGKMALHKDDNTAHDSLTNLYWGTNVQNMSDKVRNGNSLKGSAHHKAQVSENQVMAMRVRLDAGEDYRTVASDFGMSLTATQSIKHRRTWKHLA